MRQITTAMIMWTNEHNGWMVGRSPSTVPGWVDSAQTQASKNANVVNPTTGTRGPDGSAWLNWERKIDPVTGNTNASSEDDNITYSSLSRYMGTPQIFSSYNGAGGLPVSNRVSDKLDAVFICPADNRASRPNAASSGANPDRYSYSMNDFVCMPLQQCSPGTQSSMWSGSPTDNQGRAYPNNPTGERIDFTFNGKMASIRHPGTIELLICEDEATLDDGCFKAGPWAWPNPVNAVASRHAAVHANASNATTGAGTLTQDTFGNVAFCDGHAEFMSRKDALRQKYSGSCFLDPPGF